MTTSKTLHTGRASRALPHLFVAALTSSLGGCSLLTSFGMYVPETDAGLVEDASTLDARASDSAVDGARTDASVDATPDGSPPADAIVDGGLDSSLDAPSGTLVSVGFAGSGSGQITQMGGSFVCPGPDQCEGLFEPDVALTLEATPAQGSVFSSWAGPCTPSGSRCTLAAPLQASMITATFDRAPVGLVVSVVGSGSVSSDSPSGLIVDCRAGSSQCSGTAPYNTPVVLRAVEDSTSPYRFDHWIAAGSTCGTDPTCTLTLTTDPTNVSAVFSDGRPILSVDIRSDAASTGTGTGSVRSLDVGQTIDCPTGGQCASPYTQGSMITLEATPSADSVFVGWTGCTSSPMPNQCSVTVDRSRTVAATFRRESYLVQVTVDDGGRVTAPTRIDCGPGGSAAMCSETYVRGTELTLRATPDAGFDLDHWEGATCGADVECRINVTAAASVRAVFQRRAYNVNFMLAGGDGSIFRDGSPVCTSGTCPVSIFHGTAFRVSVTPNAASRFVNWGGLASSCGAATFCDLTIQAAGSVIANFAPRTATLNVVRDGAQAASGRVAEISGSPMINCGSACAGVYPYGATVRLRATTSDSNVVFAGWGSTCPNPVGANECDVLLDDGILTSDAATVRATFAPAIGSVSVTIVGNGSVSSVPGGITCPTDCSENYTAGTRITLAAANPIGSRFDGWSGACSGTTSCVLDATASALSVTATFSPQPQTVSMSVIGGGRIERNSAAVCTSASCPNIAAVYGDMISLTAVADAGRTFDGWTCSGSCGSCTGTGSCDIALTSNTIVGARFRTNTYSAGFAVSGSGTIIGTAGSSSLNCPGTCSATVSHGETVSVTAAPTVAGEIFAGWSGSCLGQGATCTLTSTAAISATATFRRPRLDLGVVATDFVGGSEITNLGPSAAIAAVGIACGGVGSDCTELVSSGALTLLRLQTRWVRVADWGTPLCAPGATSCSIAITADTALAIRVVQVANLAFVTNAVFDGNLGMLAGADAKCDAAALAANLPGHYRALLADGVTAAEAPQARFDSGTAGWVRVDGLPVADTSAQLGSSLLIHPMTLTEFGDGLPFGSRAWTGAHSGSGVTEAGGLEGSPAVPSFGRCAADSMTNVNWNSNNAASRGATGEPSRASDLYIGGYPPVGFTSSCSASLHLYCLEDSAHAYAAAVAPPPSAQSIIMFAHREPAPFAGHINVMDQRCAADAMQASLPGTFVAFAGSVGFANLAPARSAYSRILLSGPVYRPDGWPIIGDVADLNNTVTQTLTAPGGMTASASGFIRSRGFTYLTGILPGGPSAVPSFSNQTCNDYTTNLGTTAGYLGQSDGTFFNQWAIGVGYPFGPPYEVSCAAQSGWLCVRASE